MCSAKCLLFKDAGHHAINKHIPCVVGMSRAIKDSSAIAFAKSFLPRIWLR